MADLNSEELCDLFYKELHAQAKNHHFPTFIESCIMAFNELYSPSTINNSLRDNYTKHKIVINNEETIEYNTLLVYYLYNEDPNGIVEIIPTGQFKYSDTCRYLRLSINKYGIFYYNRRKCYFRKVSDSVLLLNTI